jgi:NAD(P)-dependent dehydrogenase (short-subunit alcohol dehydrogenase family)
VVTQRKPHKVVVVGASSGLGRAIALGLAARGTSVAFLARRVDRVQAAADEAGPGSIAVACDVTDESSTRSAIESAATGLGGIDGLVYCAGVGGLARLEDSTAALWRSVLDTNVTGAALATAAALPHLVASGGVAAYLSSVSASLTPPWPGLGAYAASKAALDKLVEAWRGEQPGVRFTRVVVGDTVGGEGHSATEFASGWDTELFGSCLTAWSERGYLSGSLIDVDDLVSVVAAVLTIGASIPSVSVTPATGGPTLA